MLIPQRYIPCLCLKEENDKYIPFWELTYVDGNVEDNELGYILEGEPKYRARFGGLYECIWDTIDKKVLLGTPVDHYTEPKYKPGQQVLIQINYDSLYRIDTIKSVIHGEYDSIVSKGKEAKIHYGIENADPNMLYHIRSWKNYYELESGKIIEWEHQIALLDTSPQ